MPRENCNHLASAKPISYWMLLRRNPAYRRLWLGQVVSMAGDWFRLIALYDVVMRLTGASGLALGGVLIAQSLAMFALSPVAGVLADRLSRKVLMITSDLIRAGLTLGFLLITSVEHLWLAYVLTAALMSVSSFFHPAYVATIPNVTRREELVAANALGSATWAAMLAIGSGLGGLVAATFGTNVAFCIDAATYLISAWMIATVRVPDRVVDTTDEASVSTHGGWHVFLHGLRYMGARQHVRRLLSVKAWSAGVGGGIVLLSTVFAQRVFLAGVTSLGLLYMARGVGAVFGPLLARRVVGETPQSMYRLIGVAFVLMAGFFIVFANMPTLWLAALALCLGTMASNVLWVFSSTLLQLSVPDSYRGRVFATDFALLTILMAGSTLATGWLLDRANWSPRFIATLMGVVLLLPGMFWLTPPIRRATLPALPGEASGEEDSAADRYS